MGKGTETTGSKEGKTERKKERMKEREEGRKEQRKKERMKDIYSGEKKRSILQTTINNMK